MGSPSPRAPPRGSRAASAEALERVRRAARLERTPRRTVARLRHGARGLQRLLAGLDGARAGDQAEEPVSDAPPPNLDDGRVGRELAPDEPVGEQLGRARDFHADESREPSAGAAKRTPLGVLATVTRESESGLADYRVSLRVWGSRLSCAACFPPVAASSGRGLARGGSLHAAA